MVLRPQFRAGERAEPGAGVGRGDEKNPPKEKRQAEREGLV